jgi:hypothetical protein
MFEESPDPPGLLPLRTRSGAAHRQRLQRPGSAWRCGGPQLPGCPEGTSSHASVIIERCRSSAVHVGKRFGPDRPRSTTSPSRCRRAGPRPPGPVGMRRATLADRRLQVPETGEIAIGGRIVARAGTRGAAGGRNVGVVFQDYALFPTPCRGQRRLRRLSFLTPSAEPAWPACWTCGLGDPWALPARAPGPATARRHRPRPGARPTLLLLDEPFEPRHRPARADVRRGPEGLRRRARPPSS